MSMSLVLLLAEVLCSCARMATEVGCHCCRDAVTHSSWGNVSKHYKQIMIDQTRELQNYWYCSSEYLQCPQPLLDSWTSALTGIFSSLAGDHLIHVKREYQRWVLMSKWVTGVHKNKKLTSASDHHWKRVIGDKIRHEFLAAPVCVLIQWLPLKYIQKKYVCCCFELYLNHKGKKT